MDIYFVTWHNEIVLLLCRSYARAKCSYVVEHTLYDKIYCVTKHLSPWTWTGNPLGIYRGGAGLMVQNHWTSSSRLFQRHPSRIIHIIILLLDCSVVKRVIQGQLLSWNMLLYLIWISNLIYRSQNKPLQRHPHLSKPLKEYFYRISVLKTSTLEEAYSHRYFSLENNSINLIFTIWTARNEGLLAEFFSEPLHCFTRFGLLNFVKVEEFNCGQQIVS